MTDTLLLEMDGIEKYFSGVHALNKVHFDLRYGEVHALVGENGAGKSTLMKVLTGIHAPDGGEMFLEGKPYYPKSINDSQAAGIGIVHQELNMMNHLTVAQNIFIGRESMAGGVWIRDGEMVRMTEELFRYSLIVSAPPLQLQPVDLRRALEETLLSLYGAFAQKGIAPVPDLAEPGSRFLLDAGALGRVLNNILANALKYSIGDLTVTLNREGVMTFSNRTAGMAAVDVQKLFDRYYTVETAQNSTGLGLSIARRLTGQMGGRIGAAYHNGCLTVTVDFSAARLPEDAPKTNL